MPSADSSDYSFELLLQAYLTCRKHKRNTRSALDFERDLERNLWQLHQELIAGTYRPGPSICFVITRPKPREVWAAEFRDRIVHHLLYNKISPRFHAGFIADSCACIPGRGTLYAAERLESKIRSITQNWSRPAYYLKIDLANFFVSIDKRVVLDQLSRKVTEPWWLQLTEQILMHDPRIEVTVQSTPQLLDRIPPHKSLFTQDEFHGLPIGNLSSQFFANVLLDAFDQHVKHKLQARHYIRYVDDFIILHESAQWLNGARQHIEAWLPSHLSLKVNPSKTILQTIDRGVDFVGQVIKPWHRTTRRRTLHTALARTAAAEDLFTTANSYFGLLSQATASHSDRASLANVCRFRGHSVNQSLTQCYRKKGAAS